MDTYQIDKPHYSAKQWMRYLAPKALILPILWGGMKRGVSRLLGHVISELVLPAQTDTFLKHISAPDIERYRGTVNLSFDHFKLRTHDKAELDTLKIKYNHPVATEPQFKRAIINFVGNGMAYEEIIQEMCDDAVAFQSDVIGFNLRGVGKSTQKARSKNDLVTDGIAQVQHLLNKGMSAENIVLKGHSLGAGVASLVAQHFHEQGVKVNLFNGRSFATVTNFVVGHTRLDNSRGHKESFLGKLKGYLMKPFIQFGLALTRWEIKAGKAYKAIPEAYKDYMLVRSDKTGRDAGNIDDPVIPYYASIHRSLKSERRQQKRNIAANMETMKELMSTSPGTSHTAITQAETSLHDALLSLKDRKMSQNTDDGHNVPMDTLVNRKGDNGHVFFERFVQRVEAHHGVSADVRP